MYAYLQSSIGFRQDPVDVLRARRLLWVAFLVFLSLHSTYQLQAQLSHSAAKFACVTSLTAVQIILCISGLWDGPWGGLPLTRDMLLALAHCLALILFSLIEPTTMFFTPSSPIGVLISMPCLPAAMQLVLGFVGLPLPLQLLPILVGAVISFLLVPLVNPVPVALMIVSIGFSLLGGSIRQSSESSASSTAMAVVNPVGRTSPSTSVSGITPASANPNTATAPEVQRSHSRPHSPIEVVPTWPPATISLSAMKPTRSYSALHSLPMNGEIGEKLDLGASNRRWFPDPSGATRRMADAPRPLRRGTPPLETNPPGLNRMMSESAMSDPGRILASIAERNEIDPISKMPVIERLPLLGGEKRRSLSARVATNAANIEDAASRLMLPDVAKERRVCGAQHSHRTEKPAAAIPQLPEAVIAHDKNMLARRVEISQLKQKYDAMKELHDQSVTVQQQMQQDLIQQRLETEAMKSKFDFANDQLAEAVEGKRRADEDLAIQRADQETAKTSMVEMKAKFDSLKADFDEQNVEMKQKYSVLKSQFDNDAVKAGHDLAQQAQRTSDMKQKFDAMKERHDTQRSRAQEMKSRFDEALEGKSKADVDLAHQRAQKEKAQSDAVEMKSKFDILKAEFDDQTLVANQSTEMKQKYDTLKSQFDVDAVKAEHDLEVQAEKASGMKQQYDVLKSQFDVDAANAERKIAQETERASEMKQKFDLMKNLHDQQVVERGEMIQDLEQQRTRTQEMKSKFDRANVQLMEAVVAKIEANKAVAVQAEKMEMARTEAKAKYDELKASHDRQAITQKEAEDGLAEEMGKSREMKQKYDVLKGQFDFDALKATHDLKEETQRATEMKLKYDAAHERANEATEGKLKADKDARFQKTQAENARNASAKMKNQFDDLKFNFDHQAVSMQKAEHDLADQVGKTSEMKQKFDTLKSRFDVDAETAERSLKEQTDKTIEMKQKYDTAASAQQESQKDLAKQKLQTREMKQKFDDAHEQMVEAVEGKRKADEDVIRHASALRKVKFDFGEVSGKLSESVRLKKKADDALEDQMQKQRELKTEFDSLKEGYDQLSVNKVLAEDALKNQLGQTRDAQKLYSALKSKYDAQQQVCTEQRENLSRATNHIKCLRWMLPESNSSESCETTSPASAPDFGEDLPPAPPLDALSSASGMDALSEGTTPTSIFEDVSHHSTLVNISHDMRAPLNAALASLEILLDSKVILEENDRQDLLQKVWSSIQNAMMLVNNILDMNKISNANVQVYNKQVNIRRLSIQTLRTMEVQAKQANVELVFDPAPSLPSFLRCDRVILQRVMTNLLANALKFTPKLGRVILRLGYDLTRQYLQAAVIDTGIGMTPTEQSLLFKQFYQASHVKGGSGLGLIVSQQLVKEMGGDISVTSEGKNKGSMFRFEVTAPSIRNAHNVVDITAMVVDDDPLRHQALTGMLEYVGVYILDPSHDPTTATAPNVIFLSILNDWTAVAAQWRQQQKDVLICLTVPNICPEMPSSGPLFDAVLHSPIDISELRGVLRCVNASVKSDTASHLSSHSSHKSARSNHSVCSDLDADEDLGMVRSAELSGMLAEHNLMSHTLFLRRIRHAGIPNMLSAYNGLEAVDLAEHNRFTIIIMDCELPILSGFEATTQIRNIAHHVRTPIVALTADESTEVIEKCRKSGMTAYISKPVTPQSWQTIVLIAKKRLKEEQAEHQEHEHQLQQRLLQRAEASTGDAKPVEIGSCGGGSETVRPRGSRSRRSRKEMVRTPDHSQAFGGVAAMASVDSLGTEGGLMGGLETPESISSPSLSPLSSSLVAHSSPL